MNERNEFMLSFDPKVQKREFHLGDAHTYSDMSKVLVFFLGALGRGVEGLCEWQRADQFASCHSLYSDKIQVCSYNKLPSSSCVRCVSCSLAHFTNGNQP